MIENPPGTNARELGDRLVARGRRLEAVTLGWNVVGIAVLDFAAVAARSVALAGFGLDSLIEIGASIVVLWELSGAGEDRHRAAANDPHVVDIRSRLAVIACVERADDARHRLRERGREERLARVIEQAAALHELVRDDHVRRVAADMRVGVSGRGQAALGEALRCRGDQRRQRALIAPHIFGPACLLPEELARLIIQLRVDFLTNALPVFGLGLNQLRLDHLADDLQVVRRANTAGGDSNVA